MECETTVGRSGKIGKIGRTAKKAGSKGKWKNVIRREKRISKSGWKWEDIGRERR